MCRQADMHRCGCDRADGDSNAWSPLLNPVDGILKFSSVRTVRIDACNMDINSRRIDAFPAVISVTQALLMTIRKQRISIHVPCMTLQVMLGRVGGERAITTS